MTYTPTKGSPKPPLPGNNAVEQLIEKADVLVHIIPPGVPYASQVQSVVDAIDTAITSIDPFGLRGAQRTSLCTAAENDTNSDDPAIVARGIAEATTFAQDQPAHPTPWVRRMRWICVQKDAPDPLPGGP